MKKSYLLILVGVLVVGYGGFWLGQSSRISPGSHMMDNGTMMYDGDMGDMMQMMEAMLDGKKGIELDQAFLGAMIPHHQGAVAMCQPVLKDGLHEELKALCRDIVKAQTQEIEVMRRWQKQW